MLAIPGQQPAAEPLALRRRGKGQALLASRHGAIIGDLRRDLSPFRPKLWKRDPSRIYTKTGDSGETGLFDGTRVSKADPRVEAYGDVDELNAWLGARRARTAPATSSTRCSIRSSAICLRSARCSPIRGIGLPRASRRRRSTRATSRELEQWIDTLEARLPPLRRFILAGGAPAGALLHLSRTVCRRAERAIVALGADAVDPLVVIYVNRLSDLLFVMARAANARAGAAEIEW